MADGFKIPGSDTEVPYWMIGAAALVGVVAYIASKKPVNTATAPEGITASGMSEAFNSLRQELMNYIASNVGTQTGQLTPSPWVPGTPLGAPPVPGSWAGIQYPYPTLFPPEQFPHPPYPVQPGQTVDARLSRSAQAGHPAGWVKHPAPVSSGGPGAAPGPERLNTAPALRLPASIYGFPDVAFITSPANPGFFQTPPVFRKTNLQPASGSFVNGQPPEMLIPFQSSEV